jgi:hypothetical protein
MVEKSAVLAATPTVNNNIATRSLPKKGGADPSAILDGVVITSFHITAWSRSSEALCRSGELPQVD